MQTALRSYVSASVAVIGASLIAVTPVVVTPQTAQRDVELRSVDVLADLEGMLSTLGSDISTALGQDTPAAGVILAGLIDPDLADAPAQAADTLAASDLGTGFSAALADADKAGTDAANNLGDAETAIKDVEYFAAQQSDAIVDTDATNAANDVTTAEADVTQAVAALSAADPIQVFQTDLNTDFSELVGGNALSSTMLADLIATLNAAPAAAQEAIALILDPAVAGQVTADEDASIAAQDLATAAQSYNDAALAADAAVATGQSDMMGISDATSQAVLDVNAASNAAGDAAIYGTDAGNALASLNPGDVSSELDALSSAALAQLDALGSTVWTDLQTLGTDILSLF